MGNAYCCNDDGDKIQVRFERQVLQIKCSVMQKIVEIRSKVGEMKKVSPHSMRLYYNGEILNDNETLIQKHFNVSQDHVNAVIQTEDDTSISITIRNINFTQKMQIKSTETIKQIKKRIDRKHSIAHLSQRLIFNGILLDDDCEVCRYGIQQGSVIHLCVSLNS